MKKPLISVIVTTKNSQKTIQDCLQSVQNQTYNNIELIVTDNSSSDQTVYIAKKFTSQIYKKGPERSAQRNLGIQKCKGEYVLYLDSDMSLSPKVLQECIDACSPDIVGIYIPEIIIGDSYWSKVRTFERSFYNETVIDAVRFVPKILAQKIGGFDEELYAGEDWDFDMRIRKLGKTTCIKAPLFHNETDFNITTYLKKKAYYSPNLIIYQHKWRNSVDVNKQFNLYYRLLGVFIENNKWKKVIARPDLVFGIVLLRLMVGSTYIFKKLLS